VPAWDSQLKSRKKEAMWSCASQLWVPGRSCGHGRPYLSFGPITLRHSSFRSWWLCRWTQSSKRSRVVPFFVWWGHCKGGFGGGWSLRDVHPKKYTCLPENLNTLLNLDKYLEFWIELSKHTFINLDKYLAIWTELSKHYGRVFVFLRVIPSPLG